MFKAFKALIDALLLLDKALGFIVNCIVALIKAVYRELVGQKEEEPTHGDAAFATDKELKKRGMFKPGGFLACVTKKGRKVYLGRESSLLVVANRGQGKTQAVIANVLDLKNRPMVADTVVVEGNPITRYRRDLPDLVVYDPKLGILKRTRAELEALGYRVLVVDIDDPAQSEVFYNPVSYLRIEDIYDFDRQLDVFADLLAPDAKYGKHSHFDNYPKIMIAGVIKHLLIKHKGNVTVPYAVEQLVGGKKLREEIFKEMEKSTDAIIRAAVDAFQSAGDREMGSFITTNFEKMKVWLRPSVRAITEHRDADGNLVNGFTWEEVFTDERPVAVFIRCGLGTGEGALVRLMIGNAINSAKRMFNNSNNTPLRKGLWVIVDEGATIEKCNALLEVNRELREARVNLLLCYQYESTIKSIFREDAEELIGGCSWLVYGGANEISWYERVSKLLGKRTSLGRAQSSSENGTSQSRAETATNLRNADQLAAMAFEECVLVAPGMAKAEALKPFQIVKPWPWKPKELRFYQ